MNKKSNEIKKEWIELTLCDMVDEIMQFSYYENNNEKIMQIIKEYSSQIYNSQNN